jgi:aminoglycoside phosphotransferase family enzyme/predicted kinase
MTAAKERRSGTDTSLAAALRRPECYPHPVRDVRLLETHISWVALTGSYAYKVKKPVDLGFADFSTLERRRHYCEEELRLNRRLAPKLYLEVVPIRGNPRAVHIGGDGPVIDYAVKMREFPQQSLASQTLAAGTFGAREIDLLAATIARFHAEIPAAKGAGSLGSPDSILQAAMQNFDQILEMGPGSSGELTLRALRIWTLREHARCRNAMQSRRSAGFVRECHGDLHLGNIVILDGQPLPFDCLEFNADLRWIDVISEVAFLMMDLDDHSRGDLGWRLLNRYLEETGDYASIQVLRFYLVYRALVRAKVHLMRSRQPHLKRGEKLRLARAFHGYLRLAQHYSMTQARALVIAHGLPGCGKTTVTQLIAEGLGAVRLRSDLERKRMHGMTPLAASHSGPGGGIYVPESTAATYRRLGSIARSALRCGYPVVVDAAFPGRAEREAFRAVAEAAGVPFLILDFHVPLDVLRARISARLARGDDASEANLAVLEHQVAAREPLTPAEITAAIVVDGGHPGQRKPWQAVKQRLNITY